MIHWFRSPARLLARAIAHLVSRDSLFEKPGERRPVRTPTPPPTEGSPPGGCGCQEVCP